jgi:hypothetical protein
MAQNNFNKTLHKPKNLPPKTGPQKQPPTHKNQVVVVKPKTDTISKTNLL